LSGPIITAAVIPPATPTGDRTVAEKIPGLVAF